MSEIISSGDWLPLTFFALMGISMLVYAVLDGYDLGVGMLLPMATDTEKDRMIASIGPFWDANETWLVLGVGLLLVAFPAAHGEILTSLYLPVAFMLIGLILRGVAFDFRVKAKSAHKKAWNHAFFAGSFMASFAQGYMLGHYILGFEQGAGAIVFSIAVGLAVVLGYSLIGSAWLIMKTESDLQKKSVRWARLSLYGTLLGILLVSVATPMVSERIMDKWFSMPNILFLLPVPVLTLALAAILHNILPKLPKKGDKHCWVPFVTTIGLYVLCFAGLGYSFYPYIIPEQMLIVESASAPESLMIILVGALIVLPVLFAYTFFAYKIFHGKATDLSYD